MRVSPYWISAAVVVAGLALLILVLMRAYRAFRTIVAVRGAVQGVIRNEIGLLRARKAALGVALKSRRLVQDDEGRP